MRDVLRNFNRHPEDYGYDPYSYLNMNIPDAPKMKRKQCEDGMGNVFDSVDQMCEFYEIPKNVYIARRRQGLSAAEALTKRYYDGRGNEFLTIEAMCAFYRVSPGVFYSRIQKGYSVYDSLTNSSIDRLTVYYDHRGKYHASLAAMCDYYGINVATFKNRITRGWSLEDALTIPVRHKY